MDKVNGKRERIITGVKLGIKEKRQEKKEEKLINMFALNEYLIVISYNPVNNCKDRGWIMLEKFYRTLVNIGSV
jgi:hypothetical protein